MKPRRQKMSVVKVARAENGIVQKADNGSRKRKKDFFAFVLKHVGSTLISS
jgi:hypothetical protein